MKTFTIMAPYYRHDCQECRFIGNMKGMDCYTCGDQVILRYSDEGPDYGSMPRAMAELDYDYRNVLAMERNIIEISKAAV